jgi:ABC-type Fe3+ transport system substrate-binding protein
MIYPTDGSSNVPDGFAMVANCPNPDMAALFMDFLVGAECQQVMSDEFGRRTVRDDIAQPAALPDLNDIYFIDLTSSGPAQVRKTSSPSGTKLQPTSSPRLRNRKKQKSVNRGGRLAAARRPAAVRAEVRKNR